jgi:hypothetical protein
METKPAIAKSNLQSYNIAQPNDVIDMSSQLKKFIKEQKLTTGIQGKDYVNVEGWQFAGAMLGIVPVVEYCKNISTADELKYEASVSLVNLQTGQQVGRGIAICSKLEQKKKYFDEYAIASMAQTRAIGKAYRNVLAFVMRAAGFEPTPAEEMDGLSNEPGTGATVVETPKPKATPAPATDKPAEAIKFATASQKEEIIRLLNNPVITNAEKTKMLLNINKLDEGKAADSINKLIKAIEEREAKAA